MVMEGQIVMENVRRYRAIASLCRQTAALRPLQKWSLLDQAEGWDRLAVEEAIMTIRQDRQPTHVLTLMRPARARHTRLQN
jgi:hypothetical protein